MNTGPKNHCPSEVRGARTAPMRYASIALAASITAVIGSAVTAPPAPASETAQPCLWAGIPYPSGTTVTAGGRNFHCETTDVGIPHWVRGGSTDDPSNVHNPGALGHPADSFSVGAHQPGTDHNDHCVGYQLVEGREYVYKVSVDSHGTLYWKNAGPIDEWTFDSDASRPGPSWRTGSLCHRGNLF